jgi:DNA polymerase III epsilon subunit-like protein
MIKFNKLWREVLVLDTECTHADPHQAEIVELAVAKWDQNWQYVCELFGSQKPMPPEASAITHIHPDQIAHLPTFVQSPEQVIPMLVSDRNYYVSHNIRYDRDVLGQQLNQMDADLARMITDPNRWICTLRLAKRAWPQAASHTQSYLRYWLNLPVPHHVVSHRAEPDTQVCVHLLERVVQELLNQGQITWDQHLAPQLVQLTQAPIPVSMWPFGKHKGKSFSELDTDYLLWCVDNLKFLNEQDADHDPDLTETVRLTLERRLTD